MQSIAFFLFFAHKMTSIFWVSTGKSLFLFRLLFSESADQYSRLRTKGNCFMGRKYMRI